MKVTARAFGTAVAVAAVLAIAGKAAAVECVNVRGNRGCWATLQEAVDAAAIGETIVVWPGWYKNMNTVVNKNGLTIIGDGRRPSAVVIDGGRMGLTDVVSITADNVRIENLSLRNAGENLIDVTGTGARIVKVWATGADDIGIYVKGADARILNSRVSLTSDDCVQVGAADFFMQRTRVTSCSGGCIEVTGASPTLIGNAAWICENANGVTVTGDNATVRGNKVNGSESNCLDVTGASPKVIGNDIDGCNSLGIGVTATTMMTVTGNKVSSTNGDGMSLGCAGCAGPNLVADNLIRNTVEDDDGFVITADGPTSILDNRALFIQDYGFDISGAGPFTVRRNQAREIGGDQGEYGFYIRQTGNAVVTDNVAVNVLGYGFELVDTANATIRDNRVDGCWYDGFHISESVGSSDGTTFQGNVVRNSLVSGFQIDAGVDGTTLTRNRTFLTNFPYCDLGTGTTLTGNNFSTSECP